MRKKGITFSSKYGKLKGYYLTEKKERILLREELMELYESLCDDLYKLLYEGKAIQIWIVAHGVNPDNQVEVFFME